MLHACLLKRNVFNSYLLLQHYENIELVSQEAMKKHSIEDYPKSLAKA